MINIGLIGCGQWGNNHIRVFHGLRECRVVAAADQSVERLTRVQQQYPAIECIPDVGELLARPDIHAVIVATPAATHYSIVTEALHARKHVLCEKPLCMNTLEARKLYDLAFASGVVLSVGHVFLYNAGIAKLKELIEAGHVGDLYYVSATRTNLGPIREDVNVSYDLATHDISIFNWLLDAIPETVTATGASFIQPQLEDVIFITLRYPRGTIGAVQTSWLSPRKVRKIALVGSRKMVTWDDLELNTPVAIYDRGANAKLEYNEYGEFLRISMWDGDVRLPSVAREEPLRTQDMAFLRSIREGTVDRNGCEFVVGVVRVLEAVAESLRRGGDPVRVSI
ncbi:MAG TPA: Gfo/Idh/MocA family oxidoreductase [Candidatus Acidoferrales bacterium]|nr:Gfo/Idh/MocA family oxidoreductase [Candidatus Acidoferrales bacterium]